MVVQRAPRSYEVQVNGTTTAYGRNRVHLHDSMISPLKKTPASEPIEQPPVCEPQTKPEIKPVQQSKPESRNEPQVMKTRSGRVVKPNLKYSEKS